MHKSPRRRQLESLVESTPIRAGFSRYSAKVRTAVVMWLCLAVPGALPARSATPPTQETTPEAAAQVQSADQPAPPARQTIDLSDEVVRDILNRQNMKDFAQFQDQMVAFFRRYDSIRFRYQLLQVTSDKEGGFAIADIDMDADPSDILPTPQRRSTQMRFQMKRSPKGWKVIALKPSDFFNQ